MTIKHSSLDEYFHMRNHYKKLRLAKAVIKNRPSSAPKKLTPSLSPARNDAAIPEHLAKQTRPASDTSRIDSADLQKLKKAHYPYHSIHLVKHDCSRPVTRRNPKDMPDSFESPTRLHQVDEQDEIEKLEETVGNPVLMDSSYLTQECDGADICASGDEIGTHQGIWKFDKGQESKESGRKCEHKRSVLKVYTVLPVILGNSSSELSQNTKKQEANRRLHGNKKEGEEASETSTGNELESNTEGERYTSESENEISRRESAKHVEKKGEPESSNRSRFHADAKSQVYRQRDSKKAPSDEADSIYADIKSSTSSSVNDTTTPCLLRSCRVVEHEYLQFSLRITEDIIRNDLYDLDEMKRVFNSHIEANRGRLDVKKMKEQIRDLCKELSVAYDDTIGKPSCREDVDKLQENLKSVMSYSSRQKAVCLPCSSQNAVQQLEKSSSPQIITETTATFAVEEQVKSASSNENRTATPTRPEPEAKAGPEMKQSSMICANEEEKQMSSEKYSDVIIVDEKNEKQLTSVSPAENKMTTPITTVTPTRAEPSATTDAKTKQSSEFVKTDEQRLKDAPIIAEKIVIDVTPTVTESARCNINKTSTPTTPVAPTRTGSGMKTCFKTKRSSMINENDEDRQMPPVKDNDDVKYNINVIAEKKNEGLQETNNDVQKPSDKINVVPKSVCSGNDYAPRSMNSKTKHPSVCCLGEAVCLERSFENPRTSRSDAPTPLSDDVSSSSEMQRKPNIIFVKPISPTREQESALWKSKQSSMQKPPTTNNKRCNASKKQTDTLTGISALDKTLKSYNLEMLAQSNLSGCDYQTQTEPSGVYNLLHETYKHVDFTPPKKTDDYVIVSGPIYIPARIIESDPPCDCVSPFLKSHLNVSTRRDHQQTNLLLTDDYNNSRMHPDISKFYPTISTQTSRSDLVLLDELRSVSEHHVPVQLQKAPKFTSKNFPSAPVEIKSEEEQKLSLGEVNQSSEILEVPEGDRKIWKLSLSEAAVSEGELLESAESLNDEGSSDMFLISETKSKEDSNHLKLRVNQMIDMRGEDDGSEISSESISDGHFTNSDGVSKDQHIEQVGEEKKRKKKDSNIDDFMKKLDHKPNMSMTDSMANSIKKVNRESQQFRSPDDKRITWGSRKLKIKKLTESENEISVIQEEEEEQGSEGHSIKSDNNRLDT